MTKQSNNPFTLVDIHTRVDEDGPVKWYALHPQQYGYSMERLLEAQRAHDMRAFRRWLVDDVDTSEYGSPESNEFYVEMADAFEDYMNDLGIKTEL